MLNDAQLAAVKKAFPAADTVAADAMEAWLADQAINQARTVQELQSKIATKDGEITTLKSQIPATIDPKIAAGHLNLFEKELAHVVKEGKALPNQVELLTSATKKEGKPNVAMVSPEGEIMLPASVVVQALSQNKPNGLVSETTPAQEHQRQVPEGGGSNPTPTTEGLRERIKARAQKGGAKVGA